MVTEQWVVEEVLKVVPGATIEVNPHRKAAHVVAPWGGGVGCGACVCGRARKPISNHAGLAWSRFTVRLYGIGPDT